MLFAFFGVNSARAAVPPVGSAVMGQTSASFRIGPQSFSALSNSITTLVLPIYSLSITPMGSVPLPAYTLQGFEGDTLYTTFTIENTGNAPDSVIAGSSIVSPSSIGVDRLIFFFDVNANGRFDIGENDPAYFTPNMGESFELSVGVVLLTGQGGNKERQRRNSHHRCLNH